jgi:hypothetical protein
MEGSIDSQLMMELAGQSPVLLAYLAGIVLSLVYWRRYPGPCLLTFLAAALSFVLSVTLLFLRIYVMYARADRGWDRVTVGSIFSIMAVAGGIPDHRIISSLQYLIRRSTIGTGSVPSGIKAKVSWATSGITPLAASMPGRFRRRS